MEIFGWTVLECKGFKCAEPILVGLLFFCALGAFFFGALVSLYRYIFRPVTEASVIEKAKSIAKEVSGIKNITYTEKSRACLLKKEIEYSRKNLGSAIDNARKLKLYVKGKKEIYREVSSLVRDLERLQKLSAGDPNQSEQYALWSWFFFLSSIIFLFILIVSLVFKPALAEPDQKRFYVPMVVSELPLGLVDTLAPSLPAHDFVLEFFGNGWGAVSPIKKNLQFLSAQDGKTENKKDFICNFTIPVSLVLLLLLFVGLLAWAFALYATTRDVALMLKDVDARTGNEIFKLVGHKLAIVSQRWYSIATAVFIGGLIYAIYHSGELSKCSPDGAKRNPGTSHPERLWPRYPGFRCAASGLQVWRLSRKGVTARGPHTGDVEPLSGSAQRKPPHGGDDPRRDIRRLTPFGSFALRPCPATRAGPYGWGPPPSLGKHLKRRLQPIEIKRMSTNAYIFASAGSAL
jgi:hypothetical protein